MRLHYLSVGVFLTGAVLFYSEGKIFLEKFLVPQLNTHISDLTPTHIHYYCHMNNSLYE